MRWYANVREVGGGGANDATVVLAHGYGANQGLWDKLLPALSQSNRVILFDWDFTGGGGADEQPEEGRYTFGRFADDLIALMDDKGVRGAVLVGHSMSAMAGCIASVRRPDLFSHLVLLCASPRYINSPEEGYVGGFERSGIDAMLDAMSSDFTSWVKGFAPNAVGDPASVPPIEESFLAMDPGVALELARMIFLGDQREALGAVAAPCTIVQVERDFAAPPSVAEYMRSRMTGGAAAPDVVIIDSAGHFPQLVAPHQLLAVLEGVLRRQHGDGEEEHRTVEAEQVAEVEAGGGIDITA